MLEAESTQGHVVTTGRTELIENITDPVGNRARDLSACVNM